MAAFAVTVLVLGVAIFLARDDDIEVVATTTSSSTTSSSTTTTTTPGTTTTTVADTTTTTIDPVDVRPALGVEVELDVDPFFVANTIYYDFWNGLWLAAGGGESDPDEVPEVYRVDPGTFEVIETIEVGIGGSIYFMDGNDEALWMLHPGDGAAPNTLLARWDTLNQVTTVTDFRVNLYRIGAFTAAEGGAWLAGAPEGGGREIAFFASNGSAITFIYPLPQELNPNGIAVADGAVWTGPPNLWLSDAAGFVYEVDVTTGEIIGTTEVNGVPTHIGTSSRDIWVMGLDGTLVALDRDGDIVTEWAPPQPGERACCLLADPGSDQVFYFYENGDGYFATRDIEPELVFDAGQDFVTGAAQAGTGVWTAGETITRIELGQ